jgi:hypothetical protein
MMLFLGGCWSTLISSPGIAGRFIEDSTGQPISGARVRYTNVGDRHSKESITDTDGRFNFKPEFAIGYVGFPASPVKLQVVLELFLREKHNFSSGYYFVKNTDVLHSTINAGDIRVNKIFFAP